MDYLGKDIAVMAVICIALVNNIHQAVGTVIASEAPFATTASATADPQIIRSYTCTIPSYKGPCSRKEIQYYYNTQVGQCLSFEYGGCLGNRNRFATIEACEEMCVRPFANEVPVTTITPIATDPSTTAREAPVTTTAPAATAPQIIVHQVQYNDDHYKHFDLLDRLHDQIQQKHDEYTNKVDEYYKVHENWHRDTKPDYKHAGSFNLKDVNGARKHINVETPAVGRHVYMEFNITGKR